jgi:tetratricopeptide (TPR) repeat protein
MPSVHASSARFERIRRLGEGANGVVYEAWDRERGTRVALKTLRHMAGDSLARLTREFRMIQRVIHPNLVGLYDLVSDAPEVFFTMELVEGTDFLQGVRSDQASLDQARLRECLKQLAAALSALHDAGFVHRDIKPSNVRVTREGRVVVLDFGLVAELDADDNWGQQLGAGTPAYMAPEQAVSVHVGPEVDWYAVGVMMFEALTGKVPFEGPPLQVLTRKQRDEPPPPSSVASGVPADLDSLCTALLRFDPDARPTGGHVLRALRGGTTTLRPAEGRTSAFPDAPFVGRKSQLDELRAAFGDSLSGAPMTVIVDGQPGHGKSALVHRFVSTLRTETPNVIALSARCYAHDVAPYRAVRGLLDALAVWLIRLDSSETRTLVPPGPLALVQAFPALKRVEAIAELARGHLPPFAPWGLRARAFGILRELFRRLSARRPLVLVIDDAQWADDDSLALLSELTRAPDAPRLMLVLTVTTEVNEASRVRPAPTTEWQGRSLADLHGVLRRITVGALPEEDAKALAEELLEPGAEHGRRSMAQGLASAAGGDPLLLDRMTHDADQKPPSKGVRKAQFEAVVWDALLNLDDETRAIVETLCVAGVPLGQDVLGRAVSLEGTALARNIARLDLLHLVETWGPRGSRVVAPYHERVRLAVLDRLDQRHLTELHRRIAVALERSDRIEPGPLATHWFAAGDMAQAQHYAVLAGDEAIEQMAFDCAARFYELALSGEAKGTDERRALLVKLGKARANAGWGQRAADAFRQAAAGAEATVALELRRRAAEELLMAGDIDGGTSVLRDVLARLGMWLPSSPLATLVALLFFRALLHLRGMRRSALRPGTKVPQEVLVRLNVCWVVARVLGSTDRPGSSYFATRMLLLALRWPEPNLLSGALALEAATQAAKGVRKAARVDTLLARAEAIALQSSAPFARVAGPRMRGLAAYLQGRFTEALELNDRATARILEMAPDEYFAMRQTQLYSLWALALLGEVKELSVRLTRALREATDRHDVETITVLRWGLFANAWLRDGNPAALRASVNEAMRPWAKKPYNGHHHFACNTLAQVDLYEGRGHDAFRRLVEDFPRARRAFRLNVEIRHCGLRQLRGRAAVLAAAQAGPGERSEKKRLLASAVADAKWLRRAPAAYAKPWAALVEAGIAGVRGEHERAIASLLEAISGLDTVSDRLTAAAARMRLGRLLGEPGQALFESGAAFMREQEVADPLRMAAALVPGVDAK